MPVIINGSTGISGTDGSAATPAVQGTDTNTGMFFPAADQIAFAEGGVEAMRIDASGNLGIGTTTPAAKLHVVGNNTARLDGIFALDVRPGASDYSSIAWKSTNGATTYANIGPDVVGSGSLFVNGATNIFFATGGVERMRINASGNIGIGSSNPVDRVSMIWDSAGQQGFTLRTTSGTFNGSPVVFYNSSGGLSGFIGQTASSVSYNTSSDYRLKQNVVPLTGAAARVQALKPSRFNFIADPDRTVDGFIAHEAAEVVPEAVHGEKDAVNEDGTIKAQGIDHSKLVPLLTAALQEALTEIAALKARVAALEATP